MAPINGRLKGILNMATHNISNVVMKPLLEDQFTDRDSGEIIKYKQLQLESIDPETNRIEIFRVSVAKAQTALLEELPKIVGKKVDVPVSISSNNNVTRYRLAGMIKPAQQQV